jgi:hypothetical protein
MERITNIVLRLFVYCTGAYRAFVADPAQEQAATLAAFQSRATIAVFHWAL